MEFSLKADNITFTWDEIIKLGEKISGRVIAGNLTLLDLLETERKILEFYHNQYSQKAIGYSRVSYEEYLLSDHWNRFRLMALDHYGYNLIEGFLSGPL